MVKRKKILVIDGQGGKLGRQLTERLKAAYPDAEITAVGTNSLATSNMIKGGADNAATGENSVAVCSKDADVIVGPVGIAIADSLLGEITPTMANAVASSPALKLLIPLNKCNTRIIGTDDIAVSALIEKTVEAVGKL